MPIAECSGLWNSLYFSLKGWRKIIKILFYKFFLKAENVANALMYLNQLDQLYSNQIRPR